MRESKNAGKTDMHEQSHQFLLAATFKGYPRYMKILH